MKNVALLVYDASLTGGAERVAFNLAKEFSSKYNVFFVSIFNEKKYVNKERYSYYVLNEKTVKIPFHIRKLSKKLKKYLSDNKIDILFAITAGVNEIAYLGTHGLNTKYVYCEHSNLENKTYGKKHELRQLLGAKKSNMVITLTERDRNSFIKKYHLNNDKVKSIPNWYTPNNNDIIYNSNSKKIITVGRLEKVKGYDLLLEVAKKVINKNSDWIWDIYGEGSLYQQINDKIREYNLENNIFLKGNVNNLSELYNNYAFFVMTSYYEGFSLSLLEAQSNKLPIISFDCPTGPSVIVTNNVNGYIVKPYDIDEMVGKINELIKNRKKRLLFSSNSQKDLKKYSKDVIINTWFNVIDELVK